MEYVSSQSELGYGKIETYVKLDKLGEVSYWSLIVSIRYIQMLNQLFTDWGMNHLMMSKY